MNVTCDSCGKDATVTDPGDGRAVVWECPACHARNGVDGHEGEPGEGALNPAASALTDEQLAEAYERRIHALDIGGSVGPEGTTST